MPNNLGRGNLAVNLKPKPKKPRHPNQRVGGNGTAHPPGRPYEWDNGTFHTRPQGKTHRSNYHPGSGGGGNGGGGTPGPARPKKKKVDPLTRLASRYGNLAYGQTLGAINQDISNVQPYFQNFINDVNASNQLYTQQSQPILQQAQQQVGVAGQVAPGAAQDPEAQLAAQSRAALTNLGLMTLRSQVNANQGYFAGQAGPVAAAGRVQLQTQLGQEKRQALRDRGNYVATKRQDLADTQHKQKLEDAAFGLDVQQEQNKQAQAQADRKAERRAANQEVITSGPFAGFTKKQVRQLSPERKAHLRQKAKSPDSVITSGAFAGHTQSELRHMSESQKQALIRRYNKKGGQGGGGSFTPTQRRAARSNVRKGIAAVKSQIAVPGYKPEGFWQRAYKGLVQEKNYDPLLARAVIQVMRHGHVNDALRKKLQREFGITGDAFKGKRVKLPPGASDVPVVGGIVGLGGI